jgi:hypothetical protein
MNNSRNFAARVLAASIALLGTNAASASIASGGSSGIFESPGTFWFSFNSAATPANLSFDLLGFGSLDGLNGYTDLFTLTVNGIETMFGTFNMGGGGYSMASGPAGMTWTTTTYGCATQPCTDVTWGGGKTEISIPISLVDGINKIEFTYKSLGTPFAGPQGLADEGWGIGSYLVTAVPEPETYAMLLAGLGMVGMMARRRRKI